jgi:hypothetical protein
MKPVPVLLVTYNRLEYTQKALAAIGANPGVPVDITVWDNNSTEAGMPEWLELVDGMFGNIHVVFSPKNVGLAPAINWFFRRNADAQYVAKVDNDTVLPDKWLADLIDVMDSRFGDYYQHVVPHKLGAVSGTCLRPNGPTFEEWTKAMHTVPFKDHKLHFNEYVLGTGVLINMDMIRERGLLFEKFPRSTDSGPDDPCLISGWTAYTREAAVYEGWKFCFYSKVPVNLLNLKAEHILSNDYPEYDAEVQKVRDQGNEWWTSVGGLDGVRKYVAEHGGLEQLLKPTGQPIKWLHFQTNDFVKAYKQQSDLPPSVWSESDHLKECATFEYWDKRVKDNGVTAAPFLSTPISRINEFTARHMEILNAYVPGKDVLETGIGWGRLSRPIAQLAKSYIGVDFIPEFIDKAKDSMPGLDFRVASAVDLPFENESFDVVVAVACLSSFAAILDKVLPELKRVLRPEGRILFLEEHYARIDWKLKNA